MLLELGGKAPLVVLDDADLDAAVDATVFGAFANQGQICMSTERLVVDEAIADAFVEKLAKRAAALPAGDPRGPVVLGSLVSLAAAERMDELIADAKAKGAVVVCGGKRNGSIVEATIVDHVTPEMRIYREESFGPVKPVIRVKATRRRSGSPTTPNTDCRRPSSAATSSGRSRSRGGSKRASATSTGRPCTTRGRCRSAASRPRATDGSAARR